jgi:hypothetical protein
VDLADANDAGRIEPEGAEIPAAVLADGGRIVADTKAKIEGVIGWRARPPLAGAEGVADGKLFEEGNVEEAWLRVLAD